MSEKDTITISEFKMWLSGFVQGKEGKLPDFEDWKEIKRMLDKVKEEKEDNYYPWVWPTIPYFDNVPPGYNKEYYISDNTGNYNNTDTKFT